jgi:hypothetical protein
VLFVDAARPFDALRAASERWQADWGAGLRLALPGRTGRLRIDAAHGLVDGAQAVSIAFESTAGSGSR